MQVGSFTRTAYRYSAKSANGVDAEESLIARNVQKVRNTDDVHNIIVADFHLK